MSRSKTRKTIKAKPIYAFIDAANLFYGGKKSLGWEIDYKNFFDYLKTKYKVRKVFYYAGIDIYDFKYSPLNQNPINLVKLIAHLKRRLRTSRHLTESDVFLLGIHIQRAKFYKKLQQFGYVLRLKPVKTYHGNDGKVIKKANCDVDMTFDLMKMVEEYSSVVILSGDGDFIPVLDHLQHIKKGLIILARSERTAKEMKQLAGANFRDFHYLRELLRFKRK